MMNKAGVSKGFRMNPIIPILTEVSIKSAYQNLLRMKKLDIL